MKCSLMMIVSALSLMLVGIPAAVAQSEGSDLASDPGLLRTHEARVAHTSTTLDDGSVLIAGGTDTLRMLASAEVFDPVSRRFEPAGSLVVPRAHHTATLLPDGRVLMAGGGFPRPTRVIEIYDPATASFSRIGRLKTPRVLHTATLLADGRVLVAGGSGKSSKPLSSAELIDPATGTSQQIKAMRTTRAGHTATPMADGRVVVVGGFDKRGRALRSTEVFDPDRGRFKRATKLPLEAIRHATTPLEDGRLLVAAPEGAMTVARDVRKAARVAGSPRPMGPGASTLTPLDDGRVVTIGGDGRIPRVDVFDSVTGSFEDGGTLTLTRIDHRASRLDDGTILVTGGWACGAALDAAEIWDPEALATLATGSATDCDPSVPHEPPPLPPLGGTAAGGRIEMPGSAFAITVPDDWTVELAEPDTDVFSAEPGSAWEALRATAPDRSMACSVSVGVSEVSLRKRSGMGSGGYTVPMWDARKRWLLLVPTPNVEETGRSTSGASPMERLHRDHDGLEHDALYALACAGDAEAVSESIMRSLEFLDRD